MENQIVAFKCGKLIEPEKRICEGTMLEVNKEVYNPFMFLDSGTYTTMVWKCSGCGNELMKKFFKPII